MSESAAAPLPRRARSQSGADGFLRRKNPASRYQNILTASPMAAATPITADTSMLPVPGSRYAQAGFAIDRQAASTSAIRRAWLTVMVRAPRVDSDPEGIDLRGIALDVGREALALV